VVVRLLGDVAIVVGEPLSSSARLAVGSAHPLDRVDGGAAGQGMTTDADPLAEATQVASEAAGSG